MFSTVKIMFCTNYFQNNLRTTIISGLDRWVLELTAKTFLAECYLKISNRPSIFLHTFLLYILQFYDSTSCSTESVLILYFIIVDFYTFTVFYDCNKNNIVLFCTVLSGSSSSMRRIPDVVVIRVVDVFRVSKSQTLHQQQRIVKLAVKLTLKHNNVEFT